MFNKSWARHLIGAAVLVAIAAPVVAAPMIDFESPSPWLYSFDGTYTQAGFLVTPTGGGGTPDAIVDISFCNPFLEYCAVGNNTSYLTTLNDAQLTITSASGDLFNLGSFDASFFPSPFINFSGSMFRLLLTGTTSGGGSVTQTVDLLGDDGFGNFSFDSYMADSAFTQLLALSFSVCLVDQTSCVAPGQNEAQFAIDNIAFNANSVPEPSAAWLAALGLAGLTLTRRRARQ